MVYCAWFLKYSFKKHFTECLLHKRWSIGKENEQDLVFAFKEVQNLTREKRNELYRKVDFEYHGKE